MILPRFGSSRHKPTSYNLPCATLIPPPERILELKDLHIKAFDGFLPNVSKRYVGGVYTRSRPNKNKTKTRPSRRIVSKPVIGQKSPTKISEKDDPNHGIRNLIVPKIKKVVNKVFLSHNLPKIIPKAIPKPLENI